MPLSAACVKPHILEAGLASNPTIAIKTKSNEQQDQLTSEIQLLKRRQVRQSL